jgi:histidinol dehydrogenase
MRVLKGEAARRAVRKLARRGSDIDPKITRTVQRIIRDVRTKGDDALRNHSEKLDSLPRGAKFEVPQRELRESLDKISPELRKALDQAAANIRKFCEWQMPAEWRKQIAPGVEVGQIVRPIDSVGCYAPGGRYPLPSSVLMTVIPAQVAGVKSIVVCSPRPAPETLAAAALLGVEAFYRVGGAQAVAALAYGMKSIERVDKIVGPGNAYVTAAKKAVAFDCAIDMLAGPTEIVYLAEDGNAAFVASDLVAQAEHDPQTLAVFLTANEKFLGKVAAEATSQARNIPIAAASLKNNGLALLASSHAEALKWANAIGAEHISVAPDDASAITSGASIFVGPWSAQSLGDYCAGPNHVLPTGNVARYRGGLSVLDYLKIMTVQEVSRAGLERIGPTAVTLAEAEGLKAHAESVRIRLNASTAEGADHARA